MSDTMSSTKDERETGLHPVNIGHLVMGVALLGLVAVWGSWQGGWVAADDVRWLMPVPWVAAGLVGLVATAVTSGRRHTTSRTGWVQSPSENDETETEEQP
jgi:hypothetical protein